MYLELLKQILSIVNRENDLNGNNIVEKIGKQLQERELSTYKEWEKKNCDINYKFSNNNYYGKEELTLLRVAFLDNQENVVKALLAVKGIDVNLQDVYGKAPLHLAIEKGNENIVKALLNKGASLNLRDKSESTPLSRAAEKGKMEIVEAILANGPNDINLPDTCGYTPLCIAAYKSHHKIVRALLKAGADPLVKGRCNKDLAEMVTEDAIMRGIVCGVGIFIITSIVAAIVVTSAYFIGVSLSVGAMAGIAVAAAVLTGLVAGGITYEVYKPCDELKEAIAEKKRQVLVSQLNVVNVQSEVSSELGATIRVKLRDCEQI
ncbi:MULTISPECIES: ankyrin repeat domain-containing protein [unclassified Wolbachia]|uniref:ankyrin repeat domain-containing protein n=1 Tax=unclassified Wolbachia TaxID=2640676 RepID=UPI00201FCA4A|nr:MULTISPECIES: ankyrin repeat domain-containing protein [unclassified Wolbachia]URG39805.1 ankyrin repeat domain-containing protein [Wolbachia endosymbiont of Ostrinia furnacalis]URG40825.1 ankyrin repeat domain-containing protein [Wolbachia endosymbiont of Ostrinia scapulalis]